jgi:Electron transfer DM13
MATVTSSTSARPWPLAARIAAVPATVLILLGGLVLFAGMLAPDYTTSIIFGAVWMVVAAVALSQLAKRVPGLRWWVRGPVIVTALVVSAWAGISSFTDTEVNEKLTTGIRASDLAARAPAGEDEPAPPPRTNVQLSEGRFLPLTHGPASGEARVIDLANGGKRLVIDNLSVDNGPDLRVYLAAGDPKNDGQVDDYKDLGGLKGNKGDQQYRIPSSVNTRRYDTVYIWCRAFTVGFARAPLRAS